VGGARARARRVCGWLGRPMGANRRTPGIPRAGSSFLRALNGSQDSAQPSPRTFRSRPAVPGASPVRLPSVSRASKRFALRQSTHISILVAIRFKQSQERASQGPPRHHGRHRHPPQVHHRAGPVSGGARSPWAAEGSFILSCARCAPSRAGWLLGARPPRHSRSVGQGPRKARSYWRPRPRLASDPQPPPFPRPPAPPGPAPSRSAGTRHATSRATPRATASSPAPCAWGSCGGTRSARSTTNTATRE
jgi:hypothetical protein